MKPKVILRSEDGQGLIEYIIIVALVAVGSISLVRVLNQSVNVQFAQIAKALGAKSQDKISSPEISSTMMQKKDLSNFMRGVRNNAKSSEQNENSDGE